ncbi:hypothetical protein WJX84_003675 [Apatococcus fuscideae]|uniref:Uncharacterized protein n=1 Tax=Apatococcus fuscideae TaxID=2026836 RepID=A0AAW1RXG3_9CHLO
MIVSLRGCGFTTINNFPRVTLIEVIELSRFGIPFGLATSLGLAVRALDLPLTVTEAGDGLVPPAAAIALLGKFGGILIVIIILMAITSSGSAEMVSVSSLITYDLYKPYIAKHASGKHLLWVSRLMVAFFGLVMACVSVIFYKANINLNFLYFLMATATCGAVPPLAASVTWNKTGKYAAIFCGCFSLGTSLISTIILSYLWPQNFDWNEMRQISVFSDISKDKKSIAKEETKDALDNAEKKIWIWCIGYFYFWVILSFIWGIVAAVLAFGLPIFESRFIIFRVLYSIFPCFPILERLGTQDLADPDSDTLGRRGSSSSQSSDSQDFQDAKLNMRTPADLQHANSAQPLTANLVPPHKVSPPS